MRFKQTRLVLGWGAEVVIVTWVAKHCSRALPSSTHVLIKTILAGGTVSIPISEEQNSGVTIKSHIESKD